MTDFGSLQDLQGSYVIPRPFWSSNSSQFSSHFLGSCKPGSGLLCLHISSLFTIYHFLTFFAYVSVMPLFKPICPASETSMVMSLPRRANREENPAAQNVRELSERPMPVDTCMSGDRLFVRKVPNDQIASPCNT